MDICEFNVKFVMVFFVSNSYIDLKNLWGKKQQKSSMGENWATLVSWTT
jgi:hypothetical protein